MQGGFPLDAAGTALLREFVLDLVDRPAIGDLRQQGDQILAVGELLPAAPFETLVKVPDDNLGDVLLVGAAARSLLERAPGASDEERPEPVEQRAQGGLLARLQPLEQLRYRAEQ